MAASGLAVLLGLLLAPSFGPAAREAARPGFVGSATCATCHAAQHAEWQGSDHARAMQTATPASVLGAEMTLGAAGADLGPMTLERLRAGAALARATGLPLLVTGGPLGRDQPAIAELMAASLARDFGQPPRWVEARAADTAGNARLSAAMLREAGIASAFLVSHGWHLPRARAAFERAGLPVVNVPVRGARAPQYRLSDFIPRADNLEGSAWAIREWAGRAVYALRGSGS
jgi:uncharacterized SAM-binding protein YcdF (DUF218 family)